ncbi:MAG: hypothetical protein V3W35_04050 [Gemmatimonadota bacterium]
MHPTQNFEGLGRGAALRVVLSYREGEVRVVGPASVVDGERLESEARLHADATRDVRSLLR